MGVGLPIEYVGFEVGELVGYGVIFPGRYVGSNVGCALGILEGEDVG